MLKPSSVCCLFCVLCFSLSLISVLSTSYSSYGLQLGAGTSLPGLVAAKVGADVTLTDDSNRSEV